MLNWGQVETINALLHPFWQLTSLFGWWGHRSALRHRFSPHTHLHRRWVFSHGAGPCARISESREGVWGYTHLSSRLLSNPKSEALRGCLNFPSLLIVLHPLSCSRISSPAGWESAAWASVWSGMEIDTVGIMSEGVIWLFSVLHIGKRLPDFTWKWFKKVQKITLPAWAVLVYLVFYDEQISKADVITLGNNRA